MSQVQVEKLHFREPCVVKQNRKYAINFRYKKTSLAIKFYFTAGLLCRNTFKISKALEYSR